MSLRIKAKFSLFIIICILIPVFKPFGRKITKNYEVFYLSFKKRRDVFDLAFKLTWLFLNLIVFIESCSFFRLKTTVFITNVFSIANINFVVFCELLGLKFKRLLL